MKMLGTSSPMRRNEIQKLKARIVQHSPIPTHPPLSYPIDILMLKELRVP